MPPDRINTSGFIFFQHTNSMADMHLAHLQETGKRYFIAPTYDR